VKEGEKEKNPLRTGEKLVGLCRKAWRVVHRLYPEEFDKAVPNPWTGVTLKVRAKKKNAAVTRHQVYSFAYGAVSLGEVEVAAVSVICFEWLQRPENVVAGHIKWAGYAPTRISRRSASSTTRPVKSSTIRLRIGSKMAP
jgi:hypothetical protein